MSNIKSMGEFASNAMMVSPEAALKDALNDIGKNGSFEKGKKLLILCLDDSDDQYQVSWIQAGMKMSECLTLCDIGKTLFLDEMGY